MYTKIVKPRDFEETQKVRKIIIEKQKTIATMCDAWRREISNATWRIARNENPKFAQEQRLMIYGAPGCEVYFARMANLSIAANIYRLYEQENYQKWRMRPQTPQGEMGALRRRIQRYQMTRNNELRRRKTDGDNRKYPPRHI